MFMRCSQVRIPDKLIECFEIRNGFVQMKGLDHVGVCLPLVTGLNILLVI